MVMCWKRNSVLFALALAAGVASVGGQDRPGLLVHYTMTGVDHASDCPNRWDLDLTVFRSGLLVATETRRDGFFRSVIGLGEEAAFRGLNRSFIENRIGRQHGRCVTRFTLGREFSLLEDTTRWLGRGDRSVAFARFGGDVAARECSAAVDGLVESIHAYYEHVVQLDSSAVVERLHLAPPWCRDSDRR